VRKKPRPPYFSEEIAAACGVSKRTLTRWFAHGILGPAPRRGPGVVYGEEQMLRARAAAALRQSGTRPHAIKGRLDGATRAELERWAGGDVTPAPVMEAATYPAVHHAHVEIAPGLTLLVREDCDPAVRRTAQEIYARYGPSRR